jgi:hypothetical protein
LAPLKMEFLIGRYIMEEKSIMIGWCNTYLIWPRLIRRNGCVWLADETYIQYGHGSL